MRTVNAEAPIRICDNGGWTDTWFAGHGSVCNIAVRPFVEVQVRLYPIGALAEPIVLHAENYGERYGFAPGALPGRHPLLEAAVAEVGIPPDASAEISVFSEVPAGCSTGTSAAAAVAVIAALDHLGDGRRSAHDIAAAAHRVEIDRLGVQSGIQDQICAAYGGVNHIEMACYPDATVTPIRLPDPVWWELERRLVLVYLGRGHESSAMHERVIAELAGEGARSPRLEVLRHAAELASGAIRDADFPSLGRAMVLNNEAQRRLHPAIVGADAQRVIDIARTHGSLGWKVNGAGGDGGSVTVLCGPDTEAKRRLVRAINQADPRYRVIPTQLSPHGVRAWSP